MIRDALRWALGLLRRPDPCDDPRCGRFVVDPAVGNVHGFDPSWCGPECELAPAEAQR